MKFIKIILLILVAGQGFFIEANPAIAEPAAPPVIINEIFWSGSSLSYVDEFIELYNTTDEDINIGGWMITGAATNENNLLIPTSSTIPALGFFVVANYLPDNEKSILNVEADLVTSSISLANSAARYILRNAEGQDIDLADDGEGEPMAGSNENKASMARRPNCWDGGLGECWFTTSAAVNLKPEIKDLATPAADNEWQEPKINLPPIAIIDSVASAEIGTEVIFDGASSIDPEGQELNFVWQLNNETVGISSFYGTIFDEPGTYDIKLIVDDGFNQDTTSTQIVIDPAPAPIYVPKTGDLLINEIFPNPADGSEWIEIINTTDQEIELAGWTIWDGRGKIFDLSTVIAPDDYWLITLTSHKLNNDGDQVQLKFGEEVMDSVTYGDWEDEDVSDNALCPGQGHALARALGAVDNDHDSEDFFLTITPTPGRVNKIAWLVQEEEEGEDDDRLLAENESVQSPIPASTVPAASEKKCFESGRLRITELVSDPPAGGVEWIEIYNSEQKISLEGWYVEDAAGTKTALGDYIDSFSYHVIYSPRGKLNNNGDTVILADECGNVIDAVSYGTEIPAPAKETSLALEETMGWALTYTPTPGFKNEIVFPTEEDELAVVEKDAEDDEAAIDNKKTKMVNYYRTDFSQTEIWKIGDNIRIQGVVTVEPGVLGSQFFYIGDNNGRGVQVYSYKKDFPDLENGNVVEVSGTLSQINEMWRIKTKMNEDILILDMDDVEPYDILINGISKDNLGGFVRVSGEVTEKKSSYLYVDDETGEIEIKLGNEIKMAVAPGSSLEINGILINSKNGFRLEPRSDEDFNILVEMAPVEVQEKKKRPYNNLAGFVPLGILGLIGLMNLKKLRKYFPNKKL